ncbi:DUF4365 domain-containing protein [Chenggangzhangella methanolivorans]
MPLPAEPVWMSPIAFMTTALMERFSPLIAPHGKAIPSGFPIDFQLKASVTWKVTASHIRYKLSSKNFNDLGARDTEANPIYLILMCLPKPEEHWLNVSTSHLLMRNCCYWYHVPCGSATTNTSNVTIEIPRTNLFDVGSLKALLTAARTRCGVV